VILTALVVFVTLVVAWVSLSAFLSIGRDPTWPAEDPPPTVRKVTPAALYDWQERGDAA
jgi:hypothetical protein